VLRKPSTRATDATVRQRVRTGLDFERVNSVINETTAPRLRIFFLFPLYALTLYAPTRKANPILGENAIL
jgi:hypothetical protein